MKKLILGVAMSLLLAGGAHATSIGYAKSTINRIYTFKLGDTTQQGQAIRLSKAKLQAMKGKTIDFAEFVTGSKNTTDGNIHTFITTSLGGTPLVEGSVKLEKALTWCKWTLDQPYTITGEEENLYIGYTADIKTSYKLLIADGSYDIEGYNFAYQDGKWVDTYGMNKGSAQIRVNVEGVADYPDVIMASNSFDSYFKVGGSYDFSTRFINAGTTAITSFDAQVSVNDKTVTQHFGNLNIKAKDNYSFKITGVDATEEGEKALKVTINNINGTDADTDLSDNSFTDHIFFYPRNMERSILVEGFTGQDCPNCPNGHLVLNSAIESSDESLVEVTHHAGYFPDMFTMAEDDACRFYYSNPASTFAPAVMVNRNPDPTLQSTPVINTGYNDIMQLIYHAAQSKPYVSLKLETQLDEAKRELTVKLGIKPHTTLPAGDILFNIYLVQDSLKAAQSNGGTNYIHNRVCRGAVTGNTWGILLEGLEAGKEKTWEKTITIPDSIHASYWTDDMLDDNGLYSGKYKKSQTNFPAVLKNMSVVAYVGQYDNQDNTKNVIFNCTEVKLGASHTQGGYASTAAIQNVEASADADIRVANGRVKVAGDYDHVYVYNLTGRQVDANAQLAKGVYIVKVTASGKQTTKKIFVR
mgnify:CR=1 FL=1